MNCMLLLPIQGVVELVPNNSRRGRVRSSRAFVKIRLTLTE